MLTGSTRMGSWKDAIPCAVNLMIRENEPIGDGKESINLVKNSREIKERTWEKL